MLPDPFMRSDELRSLYPTKDTVAEAIKELESRLPIITPNELTAALMQYHNTVLSQDGLRPFLPSP